MRSNAGAQLLPAPAPVDLVPRERGCRVEELEPATVVVAAALHELVEEVQAEDAARDDRQEHVEPRLLEHVVGLVAALPGGTDALGGRDRRRNRFPRVRHASTIGCAQGRDGGYRWRWCSASRCRRCPPRSKCATPTTASCSCRGRRRTTAPGRVAVTTTHATGGRRSSRPARNGGGALGVNAIAVAAQSDGVVLLDPEGRVLRPALVGADELLQIDAEWLARELGGPGLWAAACGAVPDASHAVVKLAHLHHYEPELFPQLGKVLLPHDYLTYRMVRRFVTDRGDASTTGYWSPARTVARRRLADHRRRRRLGTLPPGSAAAARARR